MSEEGSLGLKELLNLYTITGLACGEPSLVPIKAV